MYVKHLVGGRVGGSFSSVVFFVRMGDIYLYLPIYYTYIHTLGTLSIVCMYVCKVK